MRNQPTTSRLKAWMFAPLLVVACGQEGAGGSGEYVAVPLCSGPDQVLSTNQDGQLICKDLPAGAGALPDCKKYSESLTSDGAKVFCTNRNNESAQSRTALENLEKSEALIKEYTTRISKLGPAGPPPRAVYCGVTSGKTNGAIVGNGQTGVAGAAYLCQQVATCNKATAKMCTVYDMYHSVATGVITQATQLTRGWVFMASWQNFSSTATDPTAGQNDNCGGYTYPTADREWSGTQVAWDFTISKNPAGPTTIKALKFFTRIANAACNDTQPIVCCN